MATNPVSRQVEEAVTYLNKEITTPPEVAIVLGSGLGQLADEVVDAAAIPFEDIPHFPYLTVEGHAGELVIGELSGKRVIMMRGRPHFYEGCTPQEVTFPIRVMAALGARTMLATNASGGINSAFGIGDIMLIVDHINLVGLAGFNPLRGWLDEPERLRFVGMTNAYDLGLGKLSQLVAEELGVILRQGVYVMVAGPSFETPAEVRFLKVIGADAVGMSTAGEVIVARQCGMRVIGLSCVTNVLTGEAPQVSHQEVLSVARLVGPRLTALVKGIVARL